MTRAMLGMTIYTKSCKTYIHMCVCEKHTDKVLPVLSAYRYPKCYLEYNLPLYLLYFSYFSEWCLELLCKWCPWRLLMILSVSVNVSSCERGAVPLLPCPGVAWSTRSCLASLCAIESVHWDAPSETLLPSADTSCHNIYHSILNIM